MENIFETVNSEIKNAMKARQKDRLEALRGIKKVLLEAKTAQSAQDDLNDTEAIKLITKLAKQGKDSAKVYKEQGREDLYDQEMVQVSVMEEFLPEQMSESEIETKVKEIIESAGATSMKEMGKVMGKASQEMAGKADGKLISEIVKRLLS